MWSFGVPRYEEELWRLGARCHTCKRGIWAILARHHVEVKIRNGKVAQREFFWAGGRQGGYLGGCPGQKNLSPLLGAQEHSVFFGGRPWPKGADVHYPSGSQKNIMQGNLAVFFRSLYRKINGCDALCAIVWQQGIVRYGGGISNWAAKSGKQPTIIIIISIIVIFCASVEDKYWAWMASS